MQEQHNSLLRVQGAKECACPILDSVRNNLYSKYGNHQICMGPSSLEIGDCQTNKDWGDLNNNNFELSSKAILQGEWKCLLQSNCEEGTKNHNLFSYPKDISDQDYT